MAAHICCGVPKCCLFAASHSQIVFRCSFSYTLAGNHPSITLEYAAERLGFVHNMLFFSFEKTIGGTIGLLRFSPCSVTCPKCSILNIVSPKSRMGARQGGPSCPNPDLARAKLGLNPRPLAFKCVPAINNSCAPYLPSQMRIHYINFAMETEAVPVVPPSGVELLKDVLAVSSGSNSPRSPTGQVD